MLPFGGSQLCPRCAKPVYAAEQVMGPGRKLYHKPCLACTTCNKRLDSYTLLEHDQKPYCKSCHVKNFGTRDLRQANFPHRDVTPPSDNSRSTSPFRNTSLSTPPRASPLSLGDLTNAQLQSSPTSLTFPSERHLDDEDEERDTVDVLSSPIAATDSTFTGTPSNTGRYGGIPRTVPLTPTRGQSNPGRTTHIGGTPLFLGDDPSDNASPLKPLMQTTTGTRYGTALGGAVPVQLTGTGGSPRKWGAVSAPSCPRCGKSVYFAEQVKAIGKTYHKNCLRCTECSTLLDSSRLRDHDGEPLCMRCYGKLHGPQGGGYALLGKAGG